MEAKAFLKELPPLKAHQFSLKSNQNLLFSTYKIVGQWRTDWLAWKAFVITLISRVVSGLLTFDLVFCVCM